MGPSVNKAILANGIRVLTKKIPHVRSVSMGIWVTVGARDETVQENGLSHFIEHMIFKGTHKRSAFQIAKEFDAIGGQTNAFTAMENTCYHARVMDTHLPTMIDILSDIFLDSVFDPLEVDREKTVIHQEIGMVEDSPEEYIHVLSGYDFWGDNPLGRSILGSRENIARFDAETIVSFFRRLYQPRRIIISAAGNLDHQRFVEMVAARFESLSSQNAFPVRTTPDGRFNLSVHVRDLEQAHLCLGTKGLHVTHPGRYAFSILSTILGGNMSSRLFQEIRETRGLAYTVYSYVSSHEDTGMFGVYAGVDPRKLREAVEVILAEIRRTKEEPVSESELSDAKEYTRGSLLLSSESTDNQMVRLAQNEIHFGRTVPLEEVLEQVQSVTAEQIRDLADELFRSRSLTLTLLGPLDHGQSFDDMLVL